MVTSHVLAVRMLALSSEYMHTSHKLCCMFVTVITCCGVSLQHGFGQPHDVAVSGDGEAVYVAEIGPNRVWKFAQHKREQVGHNQMVNIQCISFISVRVP